MVRYQEELGIYAGSDRSRFFFMHTGVQMKYVSKLTDARRTSRVSPKNNKESREGYAGQKRIVGKSLRLKSED